MFVLLFLASPVFAAPWDDQDAHKCVVLNASVGEVEQTVTDLIKECNIIEFKSYYKEKLQMIDTSAILLEKELKKFSWLAWWCPLYWALCNRIWEVFFVAILICMPFVPDQIGAALIAILAYWTGKNGNKLAWQKRKWECLEHFKNTQKKYAHIGLWILLVIILLIVAFILGSTFETNLLDN